MEEVTRNLPQSTPFLHAPNNRTSFDSLDGIQVNSRQELQLLPTSRIRTGAQRAAVWVLAAILFLGAIGSVQYVRRDKSEDFNLQHSRPLPWKHCGNTSEEAVQNNCILDFIAGAWVPKECYDAELEEEFLQLKDWHWYEDEAGEHELSMDIIRQTGGSNPMFVTIDYHWTHCAYTWKKMHRSRILNIPIDTHIGGYEHTVHCADGLANHESTTISQPISRFYQHFETCQE